MYYIVFLIQYVYNTLFRIIEITKLELYVSDIPDFKVIFTGFSYIHVSEETSKEICLEWEIPLICPWNNHGSSFKQPKDILKNVLEAPMEPPSKTLGTSLKKHCKTYGTHLK